MSNYSLHTPESITRDLADRIRKLRLTRGWKQATLANRSAVSLASLRRFESSGQISLQSLLKLAFALNRLDDFAELLTSPAATSLAELESFERRKERQRGRI